MIDADLYPLLKVLHILSATILFGTGLGTAFHMWAAYRRGNAEALAVVSRNVVLADWLFTTPAGLFQPISGFLLLDMLGYDLLSPGLLTVYGLYVLAGVCWIRVVVLQYRIRDAAAAAAAQSGPIPDACRRAMRQWFWLGWPAFLALVVVFYSMTAKTGWS